MKRTLLQTSCTQIEYLKVVTGTSPFVRGLQPGQTDGWTVKVGEKLVN